MIINGVNRHEWHPRKGRAITIEDMEKDLAIIKMQRSTAYGHLITPTRSLGIIYATKQVST